MTPARQAALKQAAFDLPPASQVSEVMRVPDRRSTDFGQPSTGTLRPAIGSGQCRCSGCGEAFWSVSAFDRHQRLANDGSVICTHPAALTDRNGNPKPMVRNAKGWWVTELDTRKHDKPVSAQAADVLAELAR